MHDWGDQEVLTEVMALIHKGQKSAPPFDVSSNTVSTRSRRKLSDELSEEHSSKRIKTEEAVQSSPVLSTNVIISPRFCKKLLTLIPGVADQRHTSTQGETLDKLPLDAVRLILAKCDGRALLSLACVCSRLSREVARDDRLWREKCATEFPYHMLGWRSEMDLRKNGDESKSWMDVYRSYRILGQDLISCTGLDYDRKNEQKELILSMGGGYQGHLDRKVTVLIVGQAGTDKYKFARHENIPLVTQEWVKECFRQRKRVDPKEHQPSFFLGVKFCATQVQAGVRAYIEEEAIKHGGEYTADLRKDHNTHLIAVRSDGRKYEFALRWRMKVLSPKWFFECLRLKEYVDEAQYLIQPPLNPTDHVEL